MASKELSNLMLRNHNRNINSLSFSPDGRNLASGSGDKTVRIWELKTSSTLYTLKGHNGKIISVSFSPDGRNLASGSEDKMIRVWDLETSTSEPSKTLQGHDGKVTTVSFSPNGRYLASGSSIRAIRVWGSEQDLSPTTTTRFAYSSDGDTILKNRDNTILTARNLSSGEAEDKYRSGDDISSYSDLNTVEESQFQLPLLHSEFSNRPRAYGVQINHVLISKAILEHLLYEKNKFK